MRARGVEFLNIPTTYYDSLREKLKTAKITVAEDLNVVCTCNLHCCYIRESVDSLCRDGANMQYIQYLSKSRMTSPQTR